LYWLRYKNIKISFLSIKNTGKSLPLVEPQPTKKTNQSLIWPKKTSQKRMNSNQWPMHKNNHK
ncbi:hypothetical protein DERF_013493, partial [Dermatophagoides farinae]